MIKRKVKAQIPGDKIIFSNLNPALPGTRIYLKVANSAKPDIVNAK